MKLAPVAPAAPSIIPADQIPSFLDVFPGTRAGGRYQSHPGDSYYKRGIGPRIPFECASTVSEMGPNGGAWTDTFTSKWLGTAVLDVDFRREPGTNRVHLIMDGTWGTRPYHYEEDYVITDARRGYLEYVKADGSTKKPYFFTSTERADGAFDIDFESDVPYFGRMYKYGTIWKPGQGAATS
jgi:hypothetical protein